MNLIFRMPFRRIKLRKVNAIKLIKVFAILTSLCCCAQLVYASQPVVPEAKIDVSKYLSEINQPVFYIRLFGNDFPIPTRFEYMPDSHPLGVIAEFQSPNGTLIKDQPFSEPMHQSLMQWIDIGPYQDYVKEISRHPPSGRDLIRRFACYGLSVEVRTALTGVRAQAHQTATLVHNDSEYIDFVGENSDVLAKELLQLYGVLNGVVIGNTCKLTTALSPH